MTRKERRFRHRRPTVDELLMISPGERRDRTTRAEAERRWSSEDQR
ncbi:hypothetical protein [Nocardia sp. AB354]